MMTHPSAENIVAIYVLQPPKGDIYIYMLLE